jgi:outer membrane protein assembly factor BamA
MRFLRAVLILIFAAVAPCSAQQTYTAAKIVFDHPGPYSQAQLETVAGMHAGTTFKADDLGAAAQRLVDSGYFANVGATLASGRVNAITVLFGIQPIERAEMLHVGFENFVWLTHAEIDAAMQAKSPLFLDYLPENSPLGDTFDQVLTDELAAKGVTARVSHDTVEPTMLQPERALEFRVDSPVVRVANVRLAGVTSELVPLIQKAVNAASKAPYNEGLAGETTKDRILAPLLDAGYVQAALSDIALMPSVSSDGVSVVLSATLSSGEVYRVSGINFAGSSLLSAEAFASSARLHAGDVASRARLLESLAPLDMAYRRLGYMDVVVQAAPTADPATHQVAYTVSVKPGEQYRVKEITTNNLNPAAKADFDRGFTMKKGELFNPEYANGFLKNNTALKALQGYSGSWKAYADPSTHTVDLVITFVRGPYTQ